MQKTLGVVIGRFQIDNLQEGHKALLTEVKSRHSNILVFIGDRNTPVTATNPLSYEVRAAMVRSFIGKRGSVMALMDHPSNEVWSEKVDAYLDLLKETGRYSSIQLYSGRDGFVPFYSGKYPVTVLNLGMDDIRATTRRREIAENPDSIFEDRGAEFREGIIYALQHLHHRIYLTVDIACTRNNGKEILLAQRDYEVGKDIWRFPGGFVEPDESFAAAARREFQEETGGWIESPEFIGDFEINDWRLRGAKGISHKTILMHSEFGWGPLHGSDDVTNVEWCGVDYIEANVKRVLIPNHQALFMDGFIPFRNKHFK
jgi:bifunctional NMN adenylyltransferase/nudix hydrolase